MRTSRTKPLIGILLGLVVFLCSCNGNKPYETADNLNGLPYDKIIENLGQPDNETEFVLSQNLYEYQYGLLDIYKNYESEEITIRELIWKDAVSKTTTAVWLSNQSGQWVVVDNLKWNPEKVVW